MLFKNLVFIFWAQVLVVNSAICWAPKCAVSGCWGKCRGCRVQIDFSKAGHRYAKGSCQVCNGMQSKVGSGSTVTCLLHLRKTQVGAKRCDSFLDSLTFSL